jgi:hypothetical protein
VNVVCPQCKKVVARQVWRKNLKEELIPMPGTKLEVRMKEAPKLRCKCGHLLVLLRGATS